MKPLALALLSLCAVSVLYSAQQADGYFERSLSVSGPADLDVITDSGGISVKAGSSSSLRIHAILKAQHGWFDSSDVQSRIRELESHPPVEQNGNQIRIGYVHDRDLIKGISMRFEIEAPSESRLRARADSGGIDVFGIHGVVDCKTDSGGIQIREVRSDVHAAADSGGIHIRDVRGSVFARADSGGIEAAEVDGSLDVQCDSGHIRISQLRPASIRAKADSGGINITLAHGAGYDISAQTGSGQISVPEMTVRSGFSRHHVEGRIGAGGPLVSAHADSGGITID